MSSISTTATPAERPVPAGFVLHTESTTSILFALPVSAASSKNDKETPATAPVFLNPVQEYNRDLSICAIRAWSEIRQQEKQATWLELYQKKSSKNAGKQKRKRDSDQVATEVKKSKIDSKIVDLTDVIVAEAPALDIPIPEPNLASTTSAHTDESLLPAFSFTILEALSATGLRAIRYAKEIPLLRYVVANDLEPSAVEAIVRNVEWNGLGPTTPSADAAPVASTSTAKSESMYQLKLRQEAAEEANYGKVRVNEGDACVVMYSHRTPDKRFDCIDLDPYGSAVPFLDAAIGAIADGGLMCVTCTDLAVLAGHNYPEKCFSHYGGSSVNAEYSHEVALRLVLSSIATTAARYGRHIVPLVSLSIDFYVRVFFRVYTSPKEVKTLATQISTMYYCHDCQAQHMQPMGRRSETITRTGAVNPKYHNATGPPPGVGENCLECGGRFHIGGPMWSGPLHDPIFIEKILEHVRTNRDSYGTSTRIEGMLSIAQSELLAPFYFTPSRISGLFHCSAPGLTPVACVPLLEEANQLADNTHRSALVNAGYQVSRSHASAGSIKTDAPRAFVHDIIRGWIKTNPVEMKNVKAGSPTQRLLTKENPTKVDFTYNPAIETAMLKDVKLVRYQQNPTTHWGPKQAAVRSGGAKPNAAKPKPKPYAVEE